MVSTERLPEPTIGEALDRVFASIKEKEEEEEGLVIEFTTEWCGRQERHSGDIGGHLWNTFTPTSEVEISLSFTA